MSTRDFPPAPSGSFVGTPPRQAVIEVPEWKLHMKRSDYEAIQQAMRAGNRAQAGNLLSRAVPGINPYRISAILDGWAR